ncbi:MAG TPA: carboxymuconolactone decarboxylase family protein [Solirubrobacteraceae bacterium]|nr:carboxymuconolactone decarboxylase family protein [Solirubrobacteraceae bacterium]
MIVPGAMDALLKLSAAAQKSGVPTTTLYLVEMRASQINGCSVCLDMHTREMRLAGESDERVAMVSAWREAPYYTDAERAALDLTEAATRLADSAGVPDDVWDEAARHYDKRQLAGLVLAIAGINTWNRINATTRQITGEWVEQWIRKPEPVGTTA